MQLNCEFKYNRADDTRESYTCFIRKQRIPEFTELKFSGRHIPGHSNYNVIDVIFDECDVTRIPQGVTNVFPNMQDLSIWKSNLQKITRGDLAEYKNLNRFAFCDSKLETLYGDLFKDFKNLHEIIFCGNKLKLIQPNILDRLFKLRFVDFSNNPNYSKTFSNIRGYEGNASFKEVKAELLQKFCNNSENVKNLFQKHRVEVENLEKSISEMKYENQELKTSEENLRKQLRASEEQKQELLKDLKNEKIENSNLKHNFENDIQDEIKQLLLDESFKDFSIVIDDHEFRVHKFLLIARSPTLAEILRNNPYVENLNLIDISIEVFKKVLKFLYFEELILDSETNMLQLFAAAGRLKIKKLKEIAAFKILDQVNTENALEILSLSNKYESDELRLKSYTEIKKMYPKLCFLDEWAFDPDKVRKAIDLFKEKEEAIRKIEQNFWSKIEEN